MVGFFDDDFNKLLMLSAARDMGGLLNTWGGGQGPIGPDPVAMVGLKRAMDQDRAEQARQAHLTKYVGGYDPTTDVTWNTGRMQPTGFLESSAPSAPGFLESSVASVPGREPQLGVDFGLLDDFTPMQRAVFQATSDPEERMDMVRDYAFAQPQTPKAPTTRSYNIGSEEVTEEWDPATSSWRRLGAAARWQPKTPGETERRTYQDVYGATRYLDTGNLVPGETARKPEGPGGGLTEAQMASNREVDNARQALAELQRSLPAGTSLSDELNRRMSQFDPLTGLETPDYNSYWGRLGWLAMQSKVGGDPDVNRWTTRLMPIAQPPAQVALEDPQAAPTDEGGGFFESLLNRSVAPAAVPGGPVGSGSPTFPRPTSPRSRGDLGPSGRTGASIDTMSLEDLDALVNTRGDRLSPAELQRIAARLDALERTSGRRLPR